MTSYSKTCKFTKPLQQIWIEAAVTVIIWKNQKCQAIYDYWLLLLLVYLLVYYHGCFY